MAIWSALAGPLIGAAADLIGGSKAASAQKKANQTNIQLQKEQLAWQEKMANSEWQRGVEDMKAAGLNPMLGFSQGGASTPNVSAATVNPEDAMGKGIASAGNKAMQTLAMQQMAANVDLTKANTLKAIEDAKTAGVTSANAGARQEAELANIRAEYRRILEGENLTIAQRDQLERLLPGMIRQQQEQLGLTAGQASSARAETRLKEADIPSAEAAARFWKDMAGGDVDMGVLMKAIMAIRSILK